MHTRIISCGHKLGISCYLCYRKAKVLDTRGFLGVAVFKNAATRVATHCYPQHQFRREENRQWYITRHYRS